MLFDKSSSIWTERLNTDSCYNTDPWIHDKSWNANNNNNKKPSYADMAARKPSPSPTCSPSLSNKCQIQRIYAILPTDTYKTELCQHYMKHGKCSHGDACQFAHGNHELRMRVRHPRYKTMICKNFIHFGLCPYGRRCSFIHCYDDPWNHVCDQEKRGTDFTTHQSPSFTASNLNGKDVCNLEWTDIESILWKDLFHLESSFVEETTNDSCDPNVVISVIHYLTVSDACDKFIICRNNLSNY